MSMATWHTGDALTILRTLPDASVDLVLTSPPFLALRSYLPADDPNKALEIGSEATPGEFLDVLLDVVVELRRVLAPHGSLAFELGDTYSGSGGAGGDYAEGGWRENAPGFDGSASRSRKGDGWPLNKSLCCIPQLFEIALSYGFNPLTGRRLEPWRVRNLVAWCRPNPPVGALGDKFRPGTSYLTVACVGASRYFDLDAVRDPNSCMTPGGSANSRQASGDDRGQGEASRRAVKGPIPNPAGAPPLDWWEIPTHPYPGSHYATFPPALCVRPIKAMCPQKVCKVCGKPSERITGEPEYVPGPNFGGVGRQKDRYAGPGAHAYPDDYVHGSVVRTVETLGWSDCGHDDWRNGVVLDPFAGSGTTLEVATGHGRDAIGIDLDPRNLDLARQRIGMFLTEAEVA